jgi:hypothetical protein
VLGWLKIVQFARLICSLHFPPRYHGQYAEEAVHRSRPEHLVPAHCSLQHGRHMVSRGGRDKHRPPDSLYLSVIAIENIDKVAQSVNEENDGGFIEVVTSI